MFEPSLKIELIIILDPKSDLIYFSRLDPKSGLILGRLEVHQVSVIIVPVPTIISSGGLGPPNKIQGHHKKCITWPVSLPFILQYDSSTALPTLVGQSLS